MSTAARAADDAGDGNAGGEASLAGAFQADAAALEAAWRAVRVGDVELPMVELGPAEAEPLVFVPILQHLEVVYARQLWALSQTRRVLLYRRHEAYSQPVGLAERAEELRQVLDARGLERVDLVAHGDAAMVLFEFAVRYPERCRSLAIVAQAADYQIAPHPFIWLLHEAFLRLPVEWALPAGFLRRIVVNYIVARRPPRPGDGPPPAATAAPASDPVAEPAPEAASAVDVTPMPEPVPAPVPALPRWVIEDQFRQIELWPFVYKFSVLPIIHNFDMRARLAALTMPVLLINRADDALAPEAKTRWLAEHLPNCAGYHVLAGGERFFMYARAGAVNALLASFLDGLRAPRAEA